MLCLCARIAMSIFRRHELHITHGRGDTIMQYQIMLKCHHYLRQFGSGQRECWDKSQKITTCTVSRHYIWPIQFLPISVALLFAGNLKKKMPSVIIILTDIYVIFNLLPPMVISSKKQKPKEKGLTPCVSPPPPPPYISYNYANGRPWRKTASLVGKELIIHVQVEVPNGWDIMYMDTYNEAGCK